MKLTTTLNKIRSKNPCVSGWVKLNKFLGSDFDPDAEINLLTILESNGVADMLWTLRATIQDSSRISAQFAVEFAEQALPIFENKYPDDRRPRGAIAAARKYLNGEISVEELRKARDAAYAAAYAAYAAAYAAYAAAYAAYAAADAAYAAAAYAYTAAYAAYTAAYAAYAAAYAAADAAADADAREKHAEIIRTFLEA